MFNSSFAREMTDYLELRTAVLSASSASNDRRVLLLLDQYLVLSLIHISEPTRRS